MVKTHAGTTVLSLAVDRMDLATQGMTEVTILRALEQGTGRPVHELFDVIGGTSMQTSDPDCQIPAADALLLSLVSAAAVSICPRRRAGTGCMLAVGTGIMRYTLDEMEDIYMTLGSAGAGEPSPRLRAR